MGLYKHPSHEEKEIHQGEKEIAYGYFMFLDQYNIQVHILHDLHAG